MRRRARTGRERKGQGRVGRAGPPPDHGGGADSRSWRPAGPGHGTPSRTPAFAPPLTPPQTPPAPAP
ncbi:hypothetical protein FMM49_27145 [Streptomyces rimosus subsp. rimosus]|nr:hypothetical protein CTZ40_26625 [Streptomyces rimosus]QEV78074.1 hypothetical protein CP984_26590 [Streptomyces rimosus]QTL88917.1 hypothetical protein FMM49_27145 [Streptomyces rimosus subsp. rimosus]